MSGGARAVKTLIWSLWLRTRLSLVGLLGLIAVEWFVMHLIDMRDIRENEGQPGEDLLMAILLIGFPVMLSTGMALLSLSDSEDLRLGLPPRILRAPLASWQTVFAIMGYGVAFISLVALVAAFPAPRMLNVTFTPWSILAISALFATMAHAWSFAFGDSSPRIAALAAVIGAGGMTWLVQRPWLSQWVEEGQLVYLGIFGLLGCVTIYLLTVGVMRIQRSGGWEDVIRFLGTRPSKPVKPKRPFRSASAAQFWYEWRQFGWLLPAFTIATALAYFLVLPLLVAVLREAEDTQHEFSEGNQLDFSMEWFNNEQYITTGLQIACVLGGVMVGAVMFIRGGHMNKPSAFYFSRPLSIRALFNGRLRMALTSVAITLSVLMVIIGSLTLYMGATSEDPMEIGRYLKQGYETMPAWAMMGFFWAAMTFCMWLGLWSTNIVWAMGVMVVAFGLPIAGSWIAHLAGVIDADTLQAWMLKIRLNAGYASSTLFIGGFLYALFLTIKHKSVSPWMKWIALTAWIIYAAGFYVYGTSVDIHVDATNSYTFTQQWVSERFPHPIIWSTWVGFSLLPIMPLFLQPAMMNRTRHL